MASSGADVALDEVEEDAIVDEDTFNQKIYVRVGAAFVILGALGEDLLGVTGIVPYGITTIGWVLLALWGSARARQSVSTLFGFFAAYYVTQLLGYFAHHLGWL